MRSNSPTLFNNKQPDDHAWLRDIKRDNNMNREEFDARMIEERRVMLALMRVGASVTAADHVINERKKLASGEKKAELKKQANYLLDNYTANIGLVRKYATAAEFIHFADALSDFCIQDNDLTDPAKEQEKIWMKYLGANNPEADKKLGFHFGVQTWMLQHQEHQEINHLMDYLIATNSWLSINLIYQHLTEENRAHAIRLTAYQCHSAIQDGSVDVVKNLLAMGANPNAYLTYRGFFGDDQVACLFVHLIAHIRNFIGTIESLNENQGCLVEACEVPFKLPNVQETIKLAIANLRSITEEMLRAGADVDKDECGYSSVPSNPEHIPRGMAAKTLRENITTNEKLDGEQKQLLGDVLRLIIDGPKIELVSGGEASIKKAKK